MSIVLHHHHPFAKRGGSWRFATDASFELRIKHRLGPVAVKGSCRIGYGLLEVDSRGEIAIRFALEPASIELGDGRHVPAGLSLARFDSTRVERHPLAPDRLSVSGPLGVAGHPVPVEFEARLRAAESGSPELEATFVADHWRLGVTWIPAAPLKAPSVLVLRVPLMPLADQFLEQTAAAGARRPIATNNRYRLMTPGVARARRE